MTERQVQTTGNVEETSDSARSLQRSVQRDAPFRENGQNGGVPNQVDGQLPATANEVDRERDSRGRFGKGNKAALVHGAFAEVALEQKRPLIDELAAQIRADRGGDVSKVLDEVILDLARLSVLAESVFENLSRPGGATGGAIDRFLEIVKVKLLAAQRIGLKRDSRPVHPRDLPELAS